MCSIVLGQFGLVYASIAGPSYALFASKRIWAFTVDLEDSANIWAARLGLFLVLFFPFLGRFAQFECADACKSVCSLLMEGGSEEEEESVLDSCQVCFPPPQLEMNGLEREAKLSSFLSCSDEMCLLPHSALHRCK